MRREHTEGRPEKPAGRGRRLLAALAEQGRRLGRALVQGRGVLCVLRLVIVVELCLLGVGVVQRLEDSYDSAVDRAMRAAQIEMDAIEAHALAQEGGEGASGVGLSGAGRAQAMPDIEEDAPGEAPALRPRDAATIISDVTGDIDAAVSLMGDGAEPDMAGADVPALEVAADDEDEVDALIRKGVAAMVAGDMRLCILSLEQAASVAPNHPAMLYYYGLAYDKLLNPGKARDYYKRLFQMRDGAGQYFDRAARRLTYGVDEPSSLRGKLSFGPYKEQRTLNEEMGEQVKILLPILLAPGEEIRSDDIYIHIDCFELVNGRKVDFARRKPAAEWLHEVQTWDNWEEDVIVSYSPPPADEQSSSGDVKYYGFTAKMFYKGEPMDCISVPSSLILHEQMLNSRQRGWNASGLLPDDGLDPYAEEAVPYNEGFDDSAIE